MNILYPHANGPIPRIERALCVLKPMRIHPRLETAIAGRPEDGRERADLSGPQKLLTWKSGLLYKWSFPRDPAYLLRFAREFLAEAAPDARVDLLVGGDMAARIDPEALEGIGTTWTADRPDLRPWPPGLLDRIRGAGYDTIVLLYADPIGHGWRGVERDLAGLGAAHVLVANGRRRVFRLDGRARRALAWRRFLERSMLVERALLPLLVISTIPLALYDTLTGAVVGVPESERRA